MGVSFDYVVCVRETLTSFSLVWIHIPNSWAKAGWKTFATCNQPSRDYAMKFDEISTQSSRTHKVMLVEV